MIWVIFFCFTIIPCTRRQCTVFFSSLVVLSEGSLLEWGQLFSRGILWWGGNCLGDSFPWGQFSSGAIVQGAIFLGENWVGAIIRGLGQSPRGQSSSGQVSGGQFSSGTVVRSFAVKSDTHSSWYETNSYICQFSKSTVFYFIYKYKFGTNSQPNRSRAVFMKRVRLFSKQKHFLSCY